MDTVLTQFGQHDCAAWSVHFGTTAAFFFKNIIRKHSWTSGENAVLKMVPSPGYLEKVRPIPDSLEISDLSRYRGSEIFKSRSQREHDCAVSSACVGILVAFFFKDIIQKHCRKQG